MRTFIENGYFAPVTTDEVIEDGATLGGARGLGMENEIGSLEADKKADIILVDVTTPWCSPIRKADLISNIVYNANGSDVTDVFVEHASGERERSSCWRRAGS